MDIYGSDEVSIPVGWEWTGEFRKPNKTEFSLDANCYRDVSTWDVQGPEPGFPPRLILKKRPAKVWFKAESENRLAKAGDWYSDGIRWLQSAVDWTCRPVICSTRYEEFDHTTQTVAQADIDAIKNPSK